MAVPLIRYLIKPQSSTFPDPDHDRLFSESDDGWMPQTYIRSIVGNH